jgi:hypothetical protein
MLRRIFGSKYERITGIRSKLCTEALRNMSALYDIQLKENQIRERVTCKGETENEYKFWSSNRKRHAVA